MIWGGQIFDQLFANPKSLIITALVMLVMGLIPGMPHVAFLSLAIVAAGGAVWQRRWQFGIQQKQKDDSEQDKEKQQRALLEERQELDWEDVSVVDTIGLEVGYRLIPLVDTQQGGKLMDRIKGVRKKLSKRMGFLIPAVHIRDNLDIQPGCYRIILMGVTVAEAEIYPDRLLAIDSGQVFGDLEGEQTTDPAFGLKAIWIQSSQKDQAQSLGYTVVDPGTVVATYLSKIMEENSAELIGHEEIQHLLDRLESTVPKLVEEVIPDKLSLGKLLRILQNLLREQVPITDMRRIMETMAEYAPKSQDPDDLTALARIALSRLIVQNINGLNEELPVITLDPELEQILQNAVQVGGETGGGFEPSLIDKLGKSLMDIVQRQEMANQPAILLVPPQIRPIMAQFAKHSVPNLYVLSIRKYQTISN